MDNHDDNVDRVSSKNVAEDVSKGPNMKRSITGLLNELWKGRIDHEDPTLNVSFNIL